MTNLYFENFMRDFTAETSTVDGDNERSEGLEKVSRDSVLKHLSMSDSALRREFNRKGTYLKGNIVMCTSWRTTSRIHNSTLYDGTLGTAFLLLKKFQVTGNRDDLNRSAEIIKACESAFTYFRDITFLRGSAGVCALGAVVSKHQKNAQMIKYYLTRFKEIEVKEHKRDGMLYGRAGHLWACMYLNKHLGDGVIPSSYTNAILNKMIENGRKLGHGTQCPLMFTWFGTKYLGAAHGLAGILYVLMHFDLTPDVQEDIKKSVKYLINTRLPSGNYPCCEEHKSKDILVQWCHGAPGVAFTLAKAAEVFGDKEFVDAAMEAGEVVWKRGLLKRVGMCHGISGNAYVFLALYRLTGNVEMLRRAKVFACFLLGRGTKLIRKKVMHGGDNPYSLFEGVGGMAYLFLDMMNPATARFPGFEF